MRNEIEIWRMASALVSSYGEQAESVAARYYGRTLLWQRR